MRHNKLLSCREPRPCKQTCARSRYGEKEWAAAVGRHLEKLECYNPQVHKAFRDALAWLSDWACSRSFGLGTRMPWDEQFLIESLSDSTIYMAYYLVAHHLQGGELDGRTTGPSGIKPEQCTEAFWDCVMLGAKYDAKLGIPAATIAKLRREVSSPSPRQACPQASSQP